MLLTLDVGNSAVKGGLYEEDELITVFSIPIEAVETSDQSPERAWREALLSHLSDSPIKKVGLASVVPATADAVANALGSITDAPVLRIRPTLALPFELAYETPDTLGTDRLAAAAAGWVRYGQAISPPRSVIVVDAGTAVTCEVVHRDGVYQGGTIAAGPALSRHALQSGTAQLPAVPLALPDDPVGRSTQAALQSGIMWSLVDSVHGMTERLAATLPDDPQIVVTGGWGALLANHFDRPTHHAPHLVLYGIHHLVANEE
ncbi:MAG TPA: type III pantothenate kinase [Salinibacter sp.]|nr:type III pantothenate kinase [Salinibacter sp.]